MHMYFHLITVRYMVHNQGPDVFLNFNWLLRKKNIYKMYKFFTVASDNMCVDLISPIIFIRTYRHIDFINQT